MSSLVASFFSLVKYNGGEFKSQKQMAYLSKFLDNGIFHHTQSVTFGEYAGRTERNTRIINWAFHCDNKGVTKVIKNGSIYWERTSGAMETSSQNMAAREAMKALNKRYDWISRHCHKLAILRPSLVDVVCKAAIAGDMAKAEKAGALVTRIDNTLANLH